MHFSNPEQCWISFHEKKRVKNKNTEMEATTFVPKPIFHSKAPNLLVLLFEMFRKFGFSISDSFSRYFSFISTKMQNSIGTHDGKFHCDEVVGCFMLRQLPEFRDAAVMRFGYI